jgi:hypothetical protein
MTECSLLNLGTSTDVNSARIRERVHKHTHKYQRVGLLTNDDLKPWILFLSENMGRCILSPPSSKHVAA